MISLLDRIAAISDDALVYWDRDVVAKGLADDANDEWSAHESDLHHYDSRAHWHWMVLEVYDNHNQRFFRLYVYKNMSRFIQIFHYTPNEELHNYIRELEWHCSNPS